MRTDELRKLSNRAINECMYSDFYAAAKPEQVIGLLDEIERLKAETVAADICIANDAAVIAELTAERDAALADAAFATDKLAILFDAYENGVQCYEEPEDCSGYLGNAVRLEYGDFHAIANFLNKHRPVTDAAMKGEQS